MQSRDRGTPDKRVLVWGTALLAFLFLPAAATAEDQTQAKLLQLTGKIPARSGFAFSELTPQGPKLLYANHENTTFAIGSSFKLFILGQLASEVNQQQRRLDNLMHLSKDWVGPPHSEMANWPMGSPVTLQTLALKMISISDNTATDHLLHLLGRENVERQMPIMGHRKPSVNRPLLFTREMVMLRDKKAAGRAATWKKLDEAGRRAFLREQIADLHDYEVVDFDTAAYDLAEWHASPMDMARTLNWLRLHTRPSDRAHPLRGVIAVTTQIEFDRKLWPYVGFKGGSEAQLIAGNWLMQHRDGRWFALNVAFNRPDGELSPPEIAKVLTEMVETIGASVK